MRSILARSLLLAALAPVSACAQPALSPGVSAPVEGVVVRRPTLVVADMDRALALYRDILGLTLAEPVRPPRGEDTYDIFDIPKSPDVLWAEFDAPGRDGALGMVATGAPATIAPPRSHVAVLLQTYDRLDAIRARLIAEGYRVKQVHTIRAGVREFGFHDHDGHLIVLVEVPSR